MRVLVDTDVILDFLLARPEFVDAAQAIWEANRAGQFEGYISAVTPVNVFYLARKFKGADTAREIVNDLLILWRVAPVDRGVRQAALALPIGDFEDAVQHASASAKNLDAIVTRNVDDYRRATIEVLPPVEFLTRITSQ